MGNVVFATTRKRLHTAYDVVCKLFYNSVRFVFRKPFVSNEDHVLIEDAECEGITINGNHRPIERNEMPQREQSSEPSDFNSDRTRLNQPLIKTNPEIFVNGGTSNGNEVRSKNSLFNEKDDSIVDAQSEIKASGTVNIQVKNSLNETGTSKNSLFNEKDDSIVDAQSEIIASETVNGQVKNSVNEKSRHQAQIVDKNICLNSKIDTKKCLDEKILENLLDPEENPKYPSEFNDVNRMKRKIGVTYPDSPKVDIVPKITLESVARWFSSHQLDTTLNSLFPESSGKDQIPKCNHHSTKRLSLPNLNSGSIFFTSDGSENVKVSDHIPEPFIVDDQPFKLFSSTNLMSGGRVVFEELSKYISLPNLYEKDPIIVKDLPILILPQSSPTSKNLLEKRPVFKRFFSGGGLVEEDPSEKIFLPELCAAEDHMQKNVIAPSYKSSGGNLLPHDTDHTIFSDLLSLTVRCENKSISSEP